MIVFLLNFLKLVLYFVICIILALSIRLFTKVPNEVYRKTLHFIVLGATFVFLYVFDTWYSAVLAALTFAILVFPILSLAERFKGYSNILAERKKGELKRSLISVFAMFSIVISMTWGLLGERYIALAVILGWGVGDAAAALIGKRFGKRYLEGKFVDGKKTLEGTLAMFVSSFIVIILILIFHIRLPWYGYLTVAFLTAIVNSLVELNTKHGYDTITCPLGSLLIILPLLYIWGVLI